MTVSAVEIVTREAGSCHEPGCFADDFWRVTVGVTVDAVEHFAITFFLFEES
jgi:hypothetical protein